MVGPGGSHYCSSCASTALGRGECAWCGGGTGKGTLWDMVSSSHGGLISSIHHGISPTLFFRALVLVTKHSSEIPLMCSVSMLAFSLSCRRGGELVADCKRWLAKHSVSPAAQAAGLDANTIVLLGQDQERSLEIRNEACKWGQ